ncbi:MAG: HipA domain-containing protein [Flavobacteriales bacterium]|nr:HipA domain-containing protein [Flavobacteriales bacterium]
MEHRCLHCYLPLDAASDHHAKCASAFFGTPTAPRMPYALNQMAELAKQVVERSVAVPGVQAKLSMSVVKETQAGTHHRLTVVGALGGHFILKPPSDLYPEMPQNEHLTMRMAEAFGIRTVPSSLVRLDSGEICYITKRVDRTAKGDKIHLLDMFQITEAHDKYRGSMERIGRALHDHSSNPLLDMVFYFELTLFCFLTGNNDMHLKNFSMMESASGWVLAPAYDLLNVAILLPDDTEQLALTLEGKKRKLTKGHFERIGRGLGLSDRQVQSVFDRMQKHRPTAHALVGRSFLSEAMKTDYLSVMESRYAALGE